MSTPERENGTGTQAGVSFDHTKAYEETIMPLARQLVEACQKIGMPFVMGFQVSTPPPLPAQINPEDGLVVEAGLMASMCELGAEPDPKLEVAASAMAPGVIVTTLPEVELEFPGHICHAIALMYPQKSTEEN